MSRTQLPGTLTRTIATVGNIEEVWHIPEIELTTVWTPPTECPPIFPSLLSFGGPETTCWPPWFEDAGANEYDPGYYSPGICPFGYTVGCIAKGPGIFLPPSEGHTVGYCVPE